MKYRTAFLFMVVLSVNVRHSQSSCRDCTSRQCPTTWSLKCPNGVELDGCGCCPQCGVECPAKQNCSKVSCVVGAEGLGCPNSFEIEPCGCCERCLGDVGEKCGERTGACKRGLECHGSTKDEKVCKKDSINDYSFISCFILGYHWLDCVTVFINRVTGSD